MVEMLPGDETFKISEPWKRGVKVVCLRIKKLLYMRNSMNLLVHWVFLILEKKSSPQKNGRCACVLIQPKMSAFFQI